MPDNFRYEQNGPLATITFNRPERRNFVNLEVLGELENYIFQVRENREIRVLIVTGTGPAFCAGADMSKLKEVTDPAERVSIFASRSGQAPRVIGRIFDTILRLDCMTIGAVNGFAVGGGWALAAAMDFIVAAETAEFWVPEVELGVPFRGGPAEVLAKRLGPWRAKEAMILCRHYEARELFNMGLVNEVTAPEELMNATLRLANRLLALPAKASTRTKHSIDGVFIGPRLY
ncbi:MAG TPA: enoyl-CoA hydratase/isomerase family protein [Candidatus Binataceae bacterium]|nr:enoyl-CoA hydratase/isomerase family protein [Candidatus Binataceae bacterium]